MNALLMTWTGGPRDLLRPVALCRVLPATHPCPEVTDDHVPILNALGCAAGRARRAAGASVSGAFQAL